MSDVLASWRSVSYSFAWVRNAVHCASPTLPKRKAGIESNTFPIHQHGCPPSSPVVAIEEVLCDVEQRFDALEQLAVGYLTTVVALDVEPQQVVHWLSHGL